MFSDSHDWIMWQAARAIGEPIIDQKPVSDQKPMLSKPTGLRSAKPRHWAFKFQVAFSAWLRGIEHRPCNLGYTRRELRRHLERQFKRGMTWDNYGGRTTPLRRVWVVDHIVPKSLFAEDEKLHAYALSNLRPLWSEENIAKAAHRHFLI